jgi:ABC-type lipoprotein release transport system permease subunit
LSTTDIHFWILSGGIGISVASIIRMTFMMGGLVKEFRLHVDVSKKTHSDQELRLRALERHRRYKRDG